MKKKTFTALAALFLMALLCFPAGAQGTAHVYDDAGLLTAEQASALEQEARLVSEAYDCGVYIITVDDYQAYVDTGEVETAAEALFKGLELGYGAEESGVLLLLSMAERDYTILAHGSGNTAFTDYGKDVLSEAFLDDFGNDDWASGFQDYMDTSEWMLSQAAIGTPVDMEEEDSSGMVLVCILIGSAIVGFIIAGVVVGSMKRKLRSVAVGAEADAYVVEDSLRMSRSDDRYTHTTQARVYIPPKEESSGGGGTSVNSRGFSSKSGKF